MGKAWRMFQMLILSFFPFQFSSFCVDDFLYSLLCIFSTAEVCIFECFHDGSYFPFDSRNDLSMFLVELYDGDKIPEVLIILVSFYFLSFVKNRFAGYSTVG
jgi:hypothetical protein